MNFGRRAHLGKRDVGIIEDACATRPPFSLTRPEFTRQGRFYSSWNGRTLEPKLASRDLEVIRDIM